MPRWLSSAPRKKFPPPVTIATWVPPATTSAISTASEWATSGSTPIRPPPKTSPDSFNRTRRYQPPDPAPDDEGAASIALIGSPSVVEQWSVEPYLLRGADLEVDEAGDVHSGGVQHLLDTLLLLLHRLLLEQDDTLEEAVEATLDDLGHRSLRLALGPGRLLGHAALGLDDVAGDVLAGEVPRPHRSDLHRRGARGLGLGTGELHQHPDLRRQVGGLAVQVGRHLAVELRGPAQLQLLADDGGEIGDALLDGLPVLEGLGLQRVDVGGRRPGEVGDDVGRQGLELLVLGDEVGLRGQLDDRALGRGHEPVGGHPVAALGVLGLALHAEDLEARSRSPSASSSAFLHSIIPAPVASRSFFTSAAEKFAISVLSSSKVVVGQADGAAGALGAASPPAAGCSRSRSHSGIGSSAARRPPAAGPGVSPPPP